MKSRQCDLACGFCGGSTPPPPPPPAPPNGGGHRRTQTVDTCPLATFTTQSQAVSEACCDPGTGGCAQDGSPPAACDARCGIVFVDFFADCGGGLHAFAPDDYGDYERLEQTCAEVRPSNLTDSDEKVSCVWSETSGLQSQPKSIWLCQIVVQYFLLNTNGLGALPQEIPLPPLMALLSRGACKLVPPPPCEDDPAWVDAQYGHTCTYMTTNQDRCDGQSNDRHYADAAGVTAAEACPVACQSGCALTYNDCCALSPPPHQLRLPQARRPFLQSPTV